ncbi:MAG: hypothetical protein KKH12_14645 [Gammaproteobacteria bacterium]|nr:hypothetical protein [Gammaproteobacteria bacterium]MBU1482899.1 hypothetical protein [Gammaproteobacteria bacterium]
MRGVEFPQSGIFYDCYGLVSASRNRPLSGTSIPDYIKVRQPKALLQSASLYQLKIDFRFGKATRTLDAIIQSGAAGSFDFVFIDADKKSYDQYYEKSLALLRPGGVMAIDNVLLFGSVVDGGVLDADLETRITDADIGAMRKLNEKIATDPRVDETMLPIADGLTLVRKL